MMNDHQSNRTMTRAVSDSTIAVDFDCTNTRRNRMDLSAFYTSTESVLSLF